MIEIPEFSHEATGRSGRSGQFVFRGGAAEQMRALYGDSGEQGLADPGTTMVQEALRGVANGPDRLLVALGHDDAGTRNLESRELICDIWRADGGLGIYPLLKELADREADRVYYRLYREHLVHQLRVWVLGLYLLRRVDRLREALVREIREEPGSWSDAEEPEVMKEALRRWKATALWHDLGYVFEVQSSDRSLELIKRSLDSLAEALREPGYWITGAVFPKGQETEWRQEASGQSLSLALWGSLEHFDGLLRGWLAKGLWELLAPAGAGCALGQDGVFDGGLRPYYEACNSGGLAAEVSKHRPRFIDHGIAGALLLLRMHRYIRKYFDDLDNLLQQSSVPERGLSEGLVSSKQREEARRLAQHNAATEHTVLAAARAVALHNVAPGILDPGAARTHRLNRRLTIDLKHQPLAFLLNLSDGLQDWDRPRSSAPRDASELSDTDLDIWVTADSEKVYWHHNQGDATDAHEKLARLRMGLAARLAPISGDEGLLEFGVRVAPPSVFSTDATESDRPSADEGCPPVSGPGSEWDIFTAYAGADRVVPCEIGSRAAPLPEGGSGADRSLQVQRPGSAPPVPPLIIGREGALADLKSRLGVWPKDGHLHTPPVFVAIQGWPGVGKTTIAAQLCHDSEVASAYPDGALWVSLGPSPDLFSELATWGRALGMDDLLRTETLGEAKAQIAAVLRLRRMLLVVDDVWEQEHLAPFMVSGSGSATLITTRGAGVAQACVPTPAGIYKLPILSDEQSLLLFSTLAPKVVDQYREPCLELIEELEGLPLALQVAGRMLHVEMSFGFGVEELLADLRNGARLLDAKAPIDRTDLANETTPTVAVLLQKSTDRLDDFTRTCFAFLGPFAPKPATFDLEAMRHVWEVDDPIPIARTLVERGLLEFIRDTGRFQMHSLLVMHAKSLLS